MDIDWTPWVVSPGEGLPGIPNAGVITESDIATATAEADARGVDLPVKDGLLIDDNPKAWEKVGDPDDATTDGETELGGIARAKRGDGWWGRGPGLRARRKGIHIDAIDGAGLPSPGRWAPKDRNLPDNELAREIRQIIGKALHRSEKSLPGGSFTNALKLATAAKILKCPFDEKVIAQARDELRVALKRAGFGDGLPQAGDRAQAFEVRLLQGLLQAFDDPDAVFCEFWAKGVWLGSSTRKLPRAPAIFDRKTRWKYAAPEGPLHGEWQTNYPSLKEHARVVQAQYEEEEREGLMMRMPLGRAIDLFGNTLVLAATAAIEKKGKEGEVRVVFDGTHGVLVNLEIRVRDQVRYPTATDVRAYLEEMAAEGGTHVSLTWDVSKAHRRIPVLQEEWGRQACQVRGTAAAAVKTLKKVAAVRTTKALESKGVDPGPLERPRLRKRDFSAEQLAQTVWLNTVGTFGIGSAGYWWGRAGAALVRLSHYVQGFDQALWILLYSDDGWTTGRGNFVARDLFVHLFTLVLVGTPLAWHKLHGGEVLGWIGYALDVARFLIGISEKRVAWARRWIEDKLREGRIRLGELKEGVGRLQFVAGPLEHLRPLLGPLYAWAAAGPRHAYPRLPVMIRLILEFFSQELAACSMSPCADRVRDMGEVFRLDAKAEGEAVAIGGWRVDGSKMTKDAKWFALKLNRRNAPWAFSRGEAFRTIASLELLGILVGIMILMPLEDFRKADYLGLLTMSCGTDNLGNTFLLDKLLTTKYPLGVVLMEVAFQCRIRGATLRANWVPRLQNEEADALTNWEFRHFNPSNRIDVKLEELSFGVLDRLFEVGDEYIEMLNKLKQDSEREKKAPRYKIMKRRACDTLASRDPWRD